MKIVCSIGPNVKTTNDLDKFIDAGMDSMRLNFSHADYNKFKELIEYGKNFPNIDIIQDLQGNKLRVSPLFKGELKVREKEEVYFCSEKFYKENIRFSNQYIFIPIAFEGEFSWITKCKSILMKDATMQFKVIGKLKDKEAIKAEGIVGGMIRGEKGINAPDMDRQAMTLTLKDKKDIEFGLLNGVDVICLSYTTCKDNIDELKTYIKKIKKYNKQVKIPKIWAKVECREAIENFDEILKSVDGIMLGRGDLVSEIDITDIPYIQNQIIKKMKSKKKELIIATYVMDSMKRSIIPQISEVDDLYHFIENKVDRVMLAGEVGIGRNPIETIEVTKKIINKYGHNVF